MWFMEVNLKTLIYTIRKLIQSKTEKNTGVAYENVFGT